MKSVTSSVLITSLLAASLLAFCAPQPAYAAAKSGDAKEYIRTWHNACLKLTT